MTILDARNGVTETLQSLRLHESMVVFDASAFTRLADEMQKVTLVFDTTISTLADDMQKVKGLGAALAQFEGIEKFDLARFDLAPYEGIGAALAQFEGIEKFDLARFDLAPHEGQLFSVTSGASESVQPANVLRGPDLRLQADPDDTAYFCARCATELRVEIRGMWPTDFPYVGSFGLVRPCPKCAGPSNDGPTDDWPPALTRRYVREGNVYYVTFGRKGR